MESRSVSDGLYVIVGSEVCIRSRDSRKLTGAQTWDCLGESVPEIRVPSTATIPRPPTSVYGELREVGEPLDLLSTRGHAARQRTEPVQTGGFGTLGG